MERSERPYNETSGLFVRALSLFRKARARTRIGIRTTSPRNAKNPHKPLDIASDELLVSQEIKTKTI